MTIKVTHTYDADQRWTIQYEAESTQKRYLIQQIMCTLI